MSRVTITINNVKPEVINSSHIKFRELNISASEYNKFNRIPEIDITTVDNRPSTKKSTVMDITITVINDTSKSSNLTGVSEFDETEKTLTTTLDDINQFNDLTTFLNSNQSSDFFISMSFIADPTPTIKDKVRKFYINAEIGLRDTRNTIFNFAPTDNDEPDNNTHHDLHYNEPPEEMRIGGVRPKKRGKTPAKKTKKSKKGGKSRKNKKTESKKRR
jgi:hypothetical protein